MSREGMLKMWVLIFLCCLAYCEIFFLLTFDAGILLMSAAIILLIFETGCSLSEEINKNQEPVEVLEVNKRG